MAQKARKRESGKAASAPAVAPAPSRGPAIVLALALALLTIAIYAQVASHEYISLDDPGYIVENAHVTTGLTRGQRAVGADQRLCRELASPHVDLAPD